MSSHIFLSCDYTFNVQKAVETDILASARGFLNILKKYNEMAIKARVSQPNLNHYFYEKDPNSF